MTKRIIALLLAFALVFALVACGGSSDDTTTDTGTTATDESTQTTTEPAEKDANSAAVDGAQGTGSTGEQVDEAEHVYTEVTVGSMGAKFVGHFDGTSGFSTDVSGAAMTLVYDRPFFTDPDTREWDSEILSDWSYDEDTLVATLQVKEGVTFARSGNQLLASDLLWSYKRNALSPLNAANWAKYTDLDNSWTSDDNMTLYLQFRVNFGAWQYQLSNCGILEEAWIADNGGEDDFDWFDPELANGTGPYIPTEFTIGVSTTYEKREDWWGSDAYTTAYCYADKINTLQYTDETTMMVDFENGNLDVVLSLSSTSMERVINDPSIGTAQSVSSNAVALLVMDYDENGDPIFENENLRKAICYGTPTDDLSELAYGVLYNHAESVLPQSSQYCVTGYSYEYDPELAQSYLDDSGLSDVTLNWVVNSGSTAATIAEAFNAYMAQIGITIDVEVYDILTCIATWETERSTDFIMVCNNNANSGGDPYVLMQYLSDAQSFYCSNRTGSEINDLINAGCYTSNVSERAEAYAALQEYLYNDYSVIPMCEWNVGLAYRGVVKSTRITDVYQANLRYLEIGND
jgi:ABC-type transport system substrate-binding protein